MHPNVSKSGFTLAELIVVVTILAILATIGFLSLSGNAQDASSAAVKANLRQIVTSVSAETASVGRSVREYVDHSSAYALTGELMPGVPFSGGQSTVSGTNYSAGKIRAGLLGSGGGTVDGKGSEFVMAGVDVHETLASGRVRSRSYFQVAGRDSGEIWHVDGEKPFESTVSGIIKNPDSSDPIEEGQSVPSSVTTPSVPASNLLVDIVPGTGNSFPGGFAILGGKLYFSADYEQSGQPELFVSNGTASGTQLFLDIRPDWSTANMGPGGLVEMGGKLYFGIDDGTHGYELWSTDGTVAGTQMVKDVRVGSAGSGVNGMTAFGGKLYFSADDGSNGTELWSTDGTAAGTQMVKDIASNPTDSSWPTGFVEMGGKLYFGALSGGLGKDLWSTDGTAAGTQMVKDLPGNGASMELSASVNGKAYFDYDDGTNGTEPWVTDGTAAGTQMLKDVNPGSGASWPGSMFAYAGKMYFTANDGTNGAEVWSTDGTAAGTQMLKDVNPGSGDGAIQGTRLFAENGGKLYFAADDGSQGRQIWVTDGTSGGTKMFADISPSVSSGWQTELVSFGGSVFFVADTPAYGTEVWTVRP